ncbi:hypothetical protein MNBD_GAMMA23-717 [hydrothermal vent metagenome]|uniref:Methyltransferase domain-containing protein n=1 Tax=hydrothermal vent metagenome TaxID=652676 RepID=A0A3B0ZJY7_9ZZZZ
MTSQTSSSPFSEKQKQAVTSNFNLVASGYDNPAQRYFPMCADRMAEYLKPKPGNRVLDIATGTGMVATAMAQAILPDGRVQGIDLSTGMLDKAFENLTKLGLNNIDLHEMDAEKLDFKSNYFDCISCGFGIFFLSDMHASLKEWLRVLKPNGRLMFTTFESSSFGKLITIFIEQLAEFNVLVDTSKERLSNMQACETYLEQAGYSDIQIHSEQLGYHLKKEDDWWEIIMNSALRSFVTQLNAIQFAQFRAQHLNEIKKLATDKGIWLDVNVIFSTGKKPAK